MFFNNINENAVMEDFPLVWLVAPRIAIGLGGRPPQATRFHSTTHDGPGCQYPPIPLAPTVGKIIGIDNTSTVGHKSQLLSLSQCRGRDHLQLQNHSDL